MINVVAQGNIEITDAIHDAIHHAAETLTKFSDASVLNVSVHVKKEHKTQFSVAITTVGKSVTANAADLYKAITDSFQKIETVLAKEKSVTLHKRNKPVQLDLTEDSE